MIKFTVSGLRGSVGANLTSLDFTKTCNAYAQFMSAEKMVLARDARITGAMVASAAFAGLSSAGTEVLGAGMVTTPTAVFATQAMGAEAGFMITASHNPYDQNGLKFLERGRFLQPSRTQDFIEYSKSCEFRQVTADEIRPAVSVDALGLHRDAVLGLFRYCGQERRLKVGLDSVNGAAGPEAIQLLEALNCEVYPLYVEPTGRFSRGPEPVPEHLAELGKMVTERSLDAGFAFDPDGDRLALVDNTGRIPGEEYTLPLCIGWGLERRKADVAVNLSTSMLSADVARKFGVEVHRTPVGEAHVVDELIGIKGSCGGEGNGGFILPDFNATRDGLLAMSVIVHLIRTKGSLAEQIDALPRYHRLKDKMDIEWSGEIVKKVSDAFQDLDADNRDGLWMGSEEYWVHLRPSNTEPVIRLMTEARSPERAEDIFKKVRSICAE